jgi:endonuclease/exonuclease/phosphatase family metal-dependent hydrolase
VRLRVLSYNIHRAIGLDRRFRLARVAKIVEHHEPDIVLLQEVDDGAPRSRRLELAKEIALACGYPYWEAGYNVRLREGRYGNATLSRWPIRASRNIDLTVGILKRRGCLHTEIDARPGHGGHPRDLHIFNLHLGLSARERRRQIARLVEAEEFARLDLAASCMVAGDFNDWRSLLLPQMVQTLGFRCATASTGLRRHLLTYPAVAPSGPLDRVYVRGFHVDHSHTSRLRLTRLASDHLPVVVNLEVR